MLLKSMIFLYLQHAQMNKNSSMKNSVKKLLSLPAIIETEISDTPDLKLHREQQIEEKLSMIDTRNGELFDEEVMKLDRWSEDLKLSLEYELKELDKLIKELRRTAALAQSLQDKLAYQKKTRELEKRRNNKRKELFEAQDAIDQQREALIIKIEKQLQHTAEIKPLFIIRWRVV